MDGAAWRDALVELAGPAAEPERTGTPLALQVQARELLPRTAHRWNGPTTRAAGVDAVGALRLGVRPVVATARGWGRGSLTWTSLPHVRNRLGVDPDQHRWMCELGALHRAAVPAAAGQDPDWLFLDDAPNPVLWSLLAQAATLGVPLVAPGRGTVRLCAPASLALDVRRRDDVVLLAPRLEVDGRAVPVERAAAIGAHGVWATGRTSADVLLAPLASPVDIALLTRAPVELPASAAGELRLRWLPELQERIPLSSSDASVVIPPPAPPRLVLTVRTEADGTAAFRWRWEGLRGGPAPTFAEAVPPGLVPDGWSDVEPSTGVPGPRTLPRDDAADVLFDVLPRLRDLEHVRVEHLGAAHPVEATGDPIIDVEVAPAERTDWFDLGVTVTIDGRRIPFGPLFRALAAGRRRLRLVDGSYLSLAHPRLAALADLIEEAADLPEWESGFAVPRSRAALWTAFEDLADSSESTAEWRALVRAVRAPPDPVPPPAGLTATLRPYQRAGLDWLAFLHGAGLGGVLADDMGLGKTLQCLALVQHLAERGATRPFLVVAPTSVASNWVAEARRFTPALDVRLVREADREGARLADAVRGAHVVVTTYARMRLDARAFTALAPGLAGVILDEAQAVKNAASRTHEVVRGLGVRFTVAVTGTPLENSLTELHALLALTAPGLFPSSRRFREEYVRPIEGLRPGYTQGVGAGNAPEANAAHRAERLARLRERIRPFVLRRTKEQVAPELPPVEEQLVHVDLAPDHRALYDVALQRERRKLFGLLPDLNRHRFIVLRSLTLLRLLALDAALIGEEHDGIRSSKLDVLAEELAEAVGAGPRARVQPVPLLPSAGRRAPRR